MSTTDKTPESLLKKQMQQHQLSPAQIKEHERNLVIMEYEHENPSLDEAPIFTDDSF